jgi:hypothetical protein
MQNVINDWDLVENVAEFFNSNEELAEDWLCLFDDYMSEEEMLESANEFAEENELPFRVISIVEQNEEGEVTWVFEKV